MKQLWLIPTLCAVWLGVTALTWQSVPVPVTAVPQPSATPCVSDCRELAQRAEELQDGLTYTSDRLTLSERVRSACNQKLEETVTRLSDLDASYQACITAVDSNLAAREAECGRLSDRVALLRAEVLRARQDANEGCQGLRGELATSRAATARSEVESRHLREALAEAQATRAETSAHVNDLTVKLGQTLGAIKSFKACVEAERKRFVGSRGFVPGIGWARPHKGSKCTISIGS